MKRIHYVDIAKGICIICVVLGHVCFGNNFLNNFINSFDLPCFFIITGILNKKRKLEAQEMNLQGVKKRCMALLWPYMTFSIIALCYKVLAYFIISHGSLEDILYAVKLTLTLDGYSTLWFIPTLLFAELLLFVGVKTKTYKRIVFIVIISIIVFYILGNSINENTSNLLVQVERVCYAYSFLVIGYEGVNLVEYSRSKIDGIRIGCAFIIGIIIARKNGYIDLHHGYVGNPILYFVGAVVTSYCVLRICYIIKENVILEYFGKNSLIVMATHLPLPMITVGSIIINKMGIVNTYVANVIVSLFVICLEILVIIFINKVCPYLVKLPKGKIKLRIE